FHSTALSTIHSFFSSSSHLRDLHSFPTRRSSDLSRLEHELLVTGVPLPSRLVCCPLHLIQDVVSVDVCTRLQLATTNNVVASNRDRKSTRLNSSHVSISYAVFCLKKKKT